MYFQINRMAYIGFNYVTGLCSLWARWLRHAHEIHSYFVRYTDKTHVGYPDHNQHTYFIVG